jgi:hypothetical protein
MSAFPMTAELQSELVLCSHQYIFKVANATGKQKYSKYRHQKHSFLQLGLAEEEIHKHLRSRREFAY